MKKILYVAAIAASLCGTSYAADSTGCGLGSTILKGKKGWFYQVLAVTTNGTSANQTFGISSGTSGCDPEGRITGGTQKVALFLEHNMDAFALDVAKGNGETINTIASIANVDANVAAKILNENFDILFLNENVDVATLSLKVAELLNIA